MEYLLKSSRHKTVLFRSTDLEAVKDKYEEKNARYPGKVFIVNANGERVNVENFKAGNIGGGDTNVPEPVSEDPDPELPEYSKYFTEPPTDSTD